MKRQTKPPKPARPRKGETDAVFCRRMGWGVGTVIKRQTQWGPRRFVITAIGESRVLMNDYGRGLPMWSEFIMAMQDCPWVEVLPVPKRKAKR